jgi:surface protein
MAGPLLWAATLLPALGNQDGSCTINCNGNATCSALLNHYADYWCGSDCTPPTSLADRPLLRNAVNYALSCGKYPSSHPQFSNCNKCFIETWNTSDQSNFDNLFEDAKISDRSSTDVHWPSVAAWETGSVTSMSETFAKSNINKDAGIESWDVSNVRDFSGTFQSVVPDAGSNDFADLSQWNVSSATTMDQIFMRSAVSSTVDLSKWNTEKLVSMNSIFAFAQHSHNMAVSGWNTQAVADMRGAFKFSNFNADLSQWKTPALTELSTTFQGSKFNADIDAWNVAGVTSLDNIFDAAQFDKEINSWNTGSVTSLNRAFSGETDVSGAAVNPFDQTLADWNVANVKDFSAAFRLSAFDKDLSKWNTASAETMDWMFYQSASYNDDLGKWDTEKLTSAQGMFAGANLFNSELPWSTPALTVVKDMFVGALTFEGTGLDHWDTSGVRDFSRMFSNAPQFNGDVSKWKTGNATTFSEMFHKATLFDISLETWDVSSGTDFTSMFQDATTGTFITQLVCWGNQLNSQDTLTQMFDGVTNVPCWYPNACNDLASTDCEVTASNCAAGSFLSCSVSTSTTTTVTTVQACPAGQEFNAAQGQCISCQNGTFKSFSPEAAACEQKINCPADTVELPLSNSPTEKTQLHRVCGYLGPCPNGHYRKNFTQGDNTSGVWIMRCDLYPDTKFKDKACPTSDSFALTIENNVIQFPTGNNNLSSLLFFKFFTTEFVHVTHLCEPWTECSRAKNKYVKRPGSTEQDRVCEYCPALAKGDSLVALYAADDPTFENDPPVCMKGADDNVANVVTEPECTGVNSDNDAYCCRKQYDKTAERYADSSFTDLSADPNTGAVWTGLNSTQYCTAGLRSQMTAITSTTTEAKETTAESTTGALTPTTAEPAPETDEPPAMIIAATKASREEKAVGYAAFVGAAVLILVGSVLAYKSSKAQDKLTKKGGAKYGKL